MLSPKEVEGNLMDKPGAFQHPSEFVHYLVLRNFLLVRLSALCQSSSFQGDFFSELPWFPFLVTRAGTLHKDNFIPVYYLEGHMHL